MSCVVIQFCEKITAAVVNSFDQIDEQMASPNKTRAKVDCCHFKQRQPQMFYGDSQRWNKTFVSQDGTR